MSLTIVMNTIVMNRIHGLCKARVMLDQFYSTNLQLGGFCLPEDTCQSLETFLVVIPKGLILGILWIEIRDAAKHPTIDRTVPTTKNLAPNVNNAKDEKSYFTHKETEAETRVQSGSI